ncbi:hypothetical protein EU546_06305 [Candidatus Thorarchaeota archaeon]|nr:MAG: hypothetical protein EU546_06305 [Candidatus Thorarchaeota archaeon]
MKRILPILVITLFLFGTFLAPSSLTTAQAHRHESAGWTAYETIESSAIPAQVRGPETIRVAVYNEPNTTTPGYSLASDLTNNYTEVVSLLEDQGYQVSILTEADILEHELTVAGYDVFVMVNNVPRVSIVKLVKEFWLAGGGILSFNSGISYLYYAGMMLPEIEQEAAPFYWGYYSHDIMNVSSFHPITQAYEVNDTVSERAKSWATFYAPVWGDFSSVIADDVEVLLTNLTQPDWGLACAIDSSYKGGRVVQLPGDGYSITEDFESLIAESVDWLAPKPKARIAFDFSHQPRLGIDPWDTLMTVYDAGRSFSQLRNAYVNHSYTLDKFYPSASGNFTPNRLANYDMLIIIWPDLNFTVSERSALMDWVQNGGSLLVLGDRTGMIGPAPGYQYLNWLIQDLSMSLGTSNVEDDITASLYTPRHPTTEACGSISVSYRNYLTVVGPAKPIYHYGGNIVLAGEIYGDGRVVLGSDMNIFDNVLLPTQSNELFGVNVADWLTAATADMLYMCNYPFSYAHATPGAEALNELGLEYQLVRSGEWLNRSIYWYDWEYLIVDAVWPLGDYFDDISNYLDSGGYLLMSHFQVATYEDDPLWARLGFQYNDSFYTPQSTFIWGDGHPIFELPIEYGFNEFVGGADYGKTGEALSVLDNGTALAGYSATPTPGNASIVLGLDGRSLYNAYLIDQYSDDTDGSAYADNYEIWLNQIAFMLRPTVDRPSDLTFEEGTTGHEITWSPQSWNPESYSIVINGTVAESGEWDGSAIAYDASQLGPGVHLVTLTCVDEYGLSASDTVMVTVTSASLIDGLDTTTLLLIGAVVLVLVIGAVVCSRRRGKK